MIVRRVRPDDAERIRAVRLRSLATDPSSFGSTLAREEAYPPEEWADWAQGDAAGDEMATLLALDENGDAIGLVGAYREDGDATLYRVIAMWVAPECRGQGLGRRLLVEIEGWIASVGGTTVQLEVASGAGEAVALYESAGYRPDGRRSPSPTTPGVDHVGLRKHLAPVELP
jgi:ribosomal protein S18 acetylase RimI-like enzyme